VVASADFGRVSSRRASTATVMVSARDQKTDWNLGETVRWIRARSQADGRSSLSSLFTSRLRAPIGFFPAVATGFPDRAGSFPALAGKFPARWFREFARVTHRFSGLLAWLTELRTRRKAPNSLLSSLIAGNWDSRDGFARDWLLRHPVCLPRAFLCCARVKAIYRVRGKSNG
jgi:hypothetical protein